MTRPIEPDYSQTVHLPQTGFPMKAGLAQREPAQLKAWEDSGAYAELLKLRHDAPKWILHDGPPFANGDVHMGTAMNKIIKDIAIRFHAMLGYSAPYVPGWDCHGMPIEFKVLKEWPKGEAKSPVAIRKRCKAEACKWIDRQREEFKRLGGWGSWSDPYLTLDPKFEAAELDAYWHLVKKGQIYRDLKPVYWCVHDQTALAEAELEYQDHQSDSIYVKFQLEAESAALAGFPGKKVFAVIWTTTPWTLPANLAVAVHPDYEYGAYEADKEIWLLAKSLSAGVLEKAGFPQAKLLKSCKGADLEGLKYLPFLNPGIRNNWQVMLATYVTLDAGTGLVHTAPGHGAEDYLTGVKYKTEIYCPVDARGGFVPTVGDARLAGMNVIAPETNAMVIEMLREKGTLVSSEKFGHSYPHCWRCKKPIIFRAAKQWFMSLDKNALKDRTLEQIRAVKWVNAWGSDRMANMMKDRADWCISRQRSWGVPIYMYYCAKCGDPFFDEACYKKLRAVVEKEGGDAWFAVKEMQPVEAARALKEKFLPEGARCACGGTEFTAESDTLDVWFDSGSSHLAVLDKHPDLHWPADLYLEGSDQYRGWFQSSLLVAMGVKGSAPYKSVVSHGWVLDSQGKAMHKSAGNAVDPLKVIEKSGADIMRLWSASENFMDDLRVGDDILNRTSDSYRRVRNTFRWLLGNLHDFDPKTMSLGLDQLLPMDRWLLGQLKGLVERSQRNLENFSYHLFTADYVQFCAVTLSSMAFDIHKDTLYTFSKNSPRRLSAQTALYQALQTLVKLAAPVLAFTCEEAWSGMPEAWKQGLASVHHSAWPEANPAWGCPELEEEFGLLFNVVRPVVMKKLEDARAAKIIGHPYDAEVALAVHSKKLFKLLQKYEGEIAAWFVVSKVALEPAAPQDGTALSPEEVKVTASTAEKCGRCWRRPGDVGKEKEHPTLCGRCVEAIN